ncbi:MAG: hypothetical protein C4576_28295 [Desulfobacteraceae bacterium]|nr:MAG: hypothetical protein C4576_28295 [Desulfobacteraceae bacterium]
MTSFKKQSVTLLFTCLLLAGLTIPCYGQEKQERVQPPTKPGKLNKRPDRYPAAIAGLEVLADLSVSPTTHNGQCPAVFTFKGKITVNRAATVQYRFVRSDNVRHALGVLTFDGPGTQEVTDTWVFDDPAQLPAFRGWEAIQINLPMKLQSNVAYFNGTCTDYKGESPVPRSPDPSDPSMSQSSGNPRGVKAPRAPVPKP